MTFVFKRSSAHEDSKHNYDAKLYNTKTASRLTDKLRAFHHIETNEEIPEFPSTTLELLGMDGMSCYTSINLLPSLIIVPSQRY